MSTPAIIPHETIYHLSGSHGAAVILRERHRQIFRTAYTSAHDDTHTDGELRLAAESILKAAREKAEGRDVSVPPNLFPWDGEDWNGFCKLNIPSMMAVAGALLAAEIDRLFRAEVQKWKVFRITEEYWWLAKNIEDAIVDATENRDWNVTREEIEGFEPYVLSMEQMCSLRFNDDDEDPVAESHGRAFQEEFERRIAGGPRTEMFATAEF